jgi:hypothetical protein
MRNYLENKSRMNIMVLPAKPADQISCSKCGIILGRVIQIDDEELIQIGSLVVSEVHGNCSQCGEEFHYSLNQRRLERLLRRRGKPGV